MSKARRKLHPKELRLLLHRNHAKRNGTVKVNGQLHVARATLNGHIIKACNGQFVSLLEHYYFPFLRFIYNCAPMCADCVRVMEREGISPPLSNTGVNFTSGGANDAQ